ncbi:MAG: hypothetical protein HY960_13345 [Ignavibacteriae bacterium]|nr:hypothetical protein [Ignavibacteriota bacterium]
MKKTVSIIFLQIVLSVSILVGQEYQSQTIITTEQGLSQNTVRDILLDERGFLWFATDDGLNKYDGYSFTMYKHSRRRNSLSGNSTSCLFEDSNNNIWIGTAGNGLNKFEPATTMFTLFLNDTSNINSISSNNVTAVLEGRDGVFWVGTSNGLNRLDRETQKFTFVPFPSVEHYPGQGDYVNTIFQSSDGLLWVGTSYGLVRCDSLGNFIHRYDENPAVESELSNRIVSTIYEDRFGQIWIGTFGGGINLYQPGQGNFKRLQSVPGFAEHIRTNYVKKIIHHDSNTIAVLTNRSVDLIDIVTHRVRNVWVNTVLTNPSALFVDASGVLWIGSTGTGIVKLNPMRKKFNSVFKGDSTKHGLSFSSVRAMYEDRDGDLWVGGHIGLNVLRKSERTFAGDYREAKWEPVQSMLGENVFSIIEDPDEANIFWFGTEGGGVARFDKRNEKVTKYHPEVTDKQFYFPGSKAFKSYITRSGQLYFGTERGLAKWNSAGKFFEDFIHENDNPTSIGPGAVKAINEDDSGKLWVGTDLGGISIYDTLTKHFLRIISDHNNPQSLSDNKVNAIYRDAKGRDWIATAAGLNLFIANEKQFVAFTTDDGLANDYIYGILEDEKGNLWLSTNRGLSMFNPETKEFTNYDRHDGLQGDEFNTLAYYKNKNGELFFGGVKGFTSFFPTEIQTNPTIPKVLITGFKKFNQTVTMEQSIEFLSELHLSYSDYVFSFEFTALEFTEPIKNKYAYMMVGFDDTWRTTTSEQRVATYTNLDAGEYVFRVIASNNDRVWNNEGTSLKIIIAPPFWEAVWFRAVGIALFASVIFGMYKFRVNSLHRQREAKQKFAHQLIESQEAERKRIASEMHDAVGQDLLIIKNLSFMALEEENNEAKEKYLSEISQTASQTIDDVRKISHNLRPFQIDKLGLTKALESLLTNISKTSSIRFTYDVDRIDGLFPKLHEIHVYRMLQECLNNIIKHSDANEAVITVRKVNGTVVITVKDDGKGFTSEPNEGELKSSEGFGLSGLTERVTILGGHLSISSKMQKGTNVSITLPVV